MDLEVEGHANMSERESERVSESTRDFGDHLFW